MRVLEPPVPSRALFWGVVASTVGLSIAGFLLRHILGASSDNAFSTTRLWLIVGTQIGLGIVWLPLLRRRGWSLACVTMSPTARDVLRSAALLVLCYSAFSLGTFVWRLVFAALMDHPHLGGVPSGWAVVVTSIVNPLFEELLYLGFITNVLRRQGELHAVAPGVIARMAMHLYQGPLRVVGMGVMGVALGVYYFRTRRLWPVVFAHSAIDFIALWRRSIGAM